MMRGVWGNPHTPLEVAELTTNGALSLAIKHKAQSQQRAAQKQFQQIVCSHQIPAGTYQLTKRINVGQNLSQTHSSSFSDYLLPK